MFRNFISRVFALWAIIIFIITLLPVALFLWITGMTNEPKRTRQFHSISRIWMRVFFFLTGCRLKIKGKENFKKGEKYIIACNHNSLMDVPVTTPFIPDANKTIAKASMAKTPLFGLIYKRGSILVDRNDKQSRQSSFRKMKEVLKLGLHVCIYPEGTRNRTALPLKPFHDGAFRLAVETGTAIIPALIFNTKKVLPPGKVFYFMPGKMEMHFLPALTIQEGENYESLKEKIYAVMSDYYMQNEPVKGKQ
jgi:1-acyl-sn-glycerol-3-phosphate acyltransferase